MGLTSSRGKRPARLHSSMMGMRLSSMNWRVVSRTRRSSSVSSESNWMKSTPRNLMAGIMNLHEGQTYDGSRGGRTGSTETGVWVVAAAPTGDLPKRLCERDNRKLALSLSKAGCPHPRVVAILIRERLNLRHAGVGTIHVTRALARVQGDVHGNYIESVGKIESVQSLYELPVGSVDVEGAAPRGRTRNRLCDQKESVDGIELDVGAAEDLLFARIWQCHLDAGLSGQVIKLHAGVVFRSSAENAVSGINRNTVNEAESETGEFAESSRGQINKANYRQASETTIASSKNCLIRRGVVGHGRWDAGEVKGIGNVDDRAKRVLGNVGREDPRNKVSAVVVGKDGDIGHALAAADPRRHDEVFASDGRCPDAGKFVHVKRIHHVEDAFDI